MDFPLKVGLWWSKLIPWLLILACGAGIVAVQNYSLNKSEGKLSKEDYQALELSEGVQLDLLRRSPAMGFDNIIADWVYLGFIQYFGDIPAREKTGYGLLPKQYQLLIEKDPLFTDALFKLDVATSLFGGQPKTSAEFLGQALAKIPKKFITNIPPYYLWRAKGNNELLFAGNVDGAKESYRQSIEWAKAYDDNESRRIIAISENSLAFLGNSPDSREARIGAWVGVLANRPDKKTVERVIREIQSLGAKVTVEPNGNITVNPPEKSQNR
jgi:hypothetical protein